MATKETKLEDSAHVKNKNADKKEESLQEDLKNLMRIEEIDEYLHIYETVRVD